MLLVAASKVIELTLEHLDALGELGARRRPDGIGTLVTARLRA
jgi:hypothetical protein